MKPRGVIEGLGRRQRSTLHKPWRSKRFSQVSEHLVNYLKTMINMLSLDHTENRINPAPANT